RAANIPAAPAPATSTSHASSMVSSIRFSTGQPSVSQCARAVRSRFTRDRHLKCPTRLKPSWGAKRGKDAAWRHGKLAKLHTSRGERIVDGVGNRRRGTDCAAFAYALVAKLGIRRRRFHMEDTDVGHFRTPRQQIIRQRRSEWLPLGVERHFLEQRGA